MTLILAARAVLLYDCRVTEDDQERILAHLRRYIPSRIDDDGNEAQWIDWFICSHRDSDHLLGLDLVHDEFTIKGIVDPGTTSGSIDSPANKYYMYLRRQLKEIHGEDAVIVPEASATALFTFDGVRLFCLCSGKDDPPSEDGHYGNNVFQVEYAGRRVLLTGDSDWSSWQDRILPLFRETGLLSSTVMVASHHGSRSFFVDADPDVEEEEAWQEAFEEHLGLIAPSMTIISCGSQEQHNHPNQEALKRYKNGTKHQQVYLTRDKGSLVGQFYANGDWTVTPARFLSGWNYRRGATPGKTLKVTCKEFRNGCFVGEVQSGESRPVGAQLKFTALTSGGFDMAKATYTFEVSNGGTGPDADHDDIYFKGSDERSLKHEFERDLAFQGIHLLRVRVRQGGIDAQTVFAVRGE